MGRVNAIDGQSCYLVLTKFSIKWVFNKQTKTKFCIFSKWLVFVGDLRSDVTRVERSCVTWNDMRAPLESWNFSCREYDNDKIWFLKYIELCSWFSYISLEIHRLCTPISHLVNNWGLILPTIFSPNWIPHHPGWWALLAGNDCLSAAHLTPAFDNGWSVPESTTCQTVIATFNDNIFPQLLWALDSHPWGSTWFFLPSFWKSHSYYNATVLPIVS